MDSREAIIQTHVAKTPKPDCSYRNKQRVLVFCSRGVTARYRHLLEDLRGIIPHHKRDVKLDSKGNLQVINEIAEVKGCNNCVFLEARKHQDLYLWLSKTPLGPSIKFNVLNVHTMDELRLTGNAMLGSRPLLSFDAAFEQQSHLQLIKAILIDIFGTPRGHPKCKPFIDRIMSFCLADGRLWVRNYQISDDENGDRATGRGVREDVSLIEIGPRFVLDPIRIFAGSFGGPTLYQSSAFVSPNDVRAERRRQIGVQSAQKREASVKRRARRSDIAMASDPIDSIWKEQAT